MARPDLLTLSLRGLAAFIILGSLGFLGAQPLGEALLPVITFILHLAAPGLAPALTLVPENHDHLIRLSAWVLSPVAVTPGKSVEAGVELFAGIHLLHTLVPSVILLATLAAWPVDRWQRRVALLGAGLALAVVLVAAVAPFQLLGQLEIQFAEFAARTGYERPVPWTLRWMIFCEMGGRWALPLAAAWLCIRWSERRLPEGGGNER